MMADSSGSVNAPVRSWRWSRLFWNYYQLIKKAVYHGADVSRVILGHKLLSQSTIQMGIVEGILRHQT